MELIARIMVDPRIDNAYLCPLLGRYQSRLLLLGYLHLETGWRCLDRYHELILNPVCTLLALVSRDHTVYLWKAQKLLDISPPMWWRSRATDVLQCNYPISRRVLGGYDGIILHWVIQEQILTAACMILRER